ncbi:MAG: hypothetical protein R3F41_20360 [Gammaproteobacteria bacterium]|nr:hypothetical protein [Pseudomonadales bacterium]MCP5346501.1 hypothetical protein [Pseudomonadales bacterium]
MSWERPVQEAAKDQHCVPPRIGSLLLEFFVPVRLREPLLGDLEEEFLLKIQHDRRMGRAYRWYWGQVLKSACLFIWMQRGTAMAFFLSVLFFLFVLTAALVTAEFGLWLLSPPVLLALVPTSLILGIGATSYQAARTAFRLSFSESDEYSPAQISLAARFLHVTGNQFLLVGGVTFFLGVILVSIGFSQNPELLNGGVRYARYGMALLPLFYGMIFKCLFYSAEQKITWKYGPAAE